ncbi:hypothetical protein [Tuwongella immobilis]|uniref:Uncharacterized protein n=1 Tax=Tuwongella immobilis TaxID=692036 RepID=A0A6C2YMB7_9BACT|nr:hypothetical protein [Tuwongella immobilis]VIP02576.1 Uncharacterized protein OS=Singulisphaera acidiphila (strain ATCC BAA-1392 / DSM 18658 / VKM B-2454 / MOB10) GN=Sinac_1168 PE=4 SV=1 [Tuwongella immobilis]VTS01817.1 Uncharacterized protein OS=Singulisphaera acidiphila (strain ATCC BAA-1392 / DSM 18658 / VKM B-2454 / MOB10) GN=Sinac_1168 PE=4 SV=1 [Tuwongella immobilis]
MNRTHGWLFCAMLLLAPNLCRAGSFDDYHNFILINAIEDGKFQEIAELTPKMLLESNNVLGDAPGTFLVVITNQGRRAKMLVQNARVKIDDEKQAPLLLVTQFLTFKEGTERAAQSKGQNLHVHAGLRLHLDFGQVVPATVGGDLEVIPDPKRPLQFTVKPVGRAKMYLVTQPLPNLAPAKSGKLVVGETFETRYFNGKYKLLDDGRRSGELTLQVDAQGNVTGHLFSDLDGEKYELTGKTGSPKHAIQFTVKLPRTEQTFTGHLFTGNGKYLAGTSQMQGRPAAFLAERIED